MATTESLLTAGEFLQRRDSQRPAELVRGKIIEMILPGFRHGRISCRIGQILSNFNDDYDVGHVVVKSGVITARDPDSVRGSDSSFYSYAKLPRDADPVGYPNA